MPASLSLAMNLASFLMGNGFLADEKTWPIIALMIVHCCAA
jgi:hypothetical protein